MSGLGIVSLAGIIVNNSIVLIDTYNRLKDDNIDPIRNNYYNQLLKDLRPIVSNYSNYNDWSNTCRTSNYNRLVRTKH